MATDTPTRRELEREAYEEKVADLRCIFHDEMVFEDALETGDLFVCPAKGCKETAIL